MTQERKAGEIIVEKILFKARLVALDDSLSRERASASQVRERIQRDGTISYLIDT